MCVYKIYLYMYIFLYLYVLSRFSHVQLCDPMDLSLPDSSVHGIFWARILEWISMPSSRRPSGLRDLLYLLQCRWIFFFFFFCLWASGDAPSISMFIPVHTSQMVLVVKNLPANAGDMRDTGLIPGLGRCPGGGNGNPFQYFCLENPMDRRVTGYSP